MNEKDKLAAEEIGYAFQDLLGFAARVDLENRIVGAFATVRQAAREAAFTQMGLELRRFGANIRREDLLTRFQELYREAADSTQKHHG